MKTVVQNLLLSETVQINVSISEYNAEHLGEHECMFLGMVSGEDQVILVVVTWEGHRI